MLVGRLLTPEITSWPRKRRVTLLREKVAFRFDVQRKSPTWSPSMLTVSRPKSKPRFSMSPKFAGLLPNPVVSGTGAGTASAGLN